MPLSTDTRALQQSIDALDRHGVVPAMATPLLTGAKAIAKALLRRNVEDIDAFSSSANPDVIPELKDHLQALAMEVCRLLDNQEVGDFAFVRRYARQRAQHRFPLEASLHTYRCSHRILSNWIRDAALATAAPTEQVRRVVAAAADFAIEYTDVVSTIATAEYVEHTRMLAEAEGDRRTELLRTLLDGYDEADNRTARLLRRAGYLEQRQSFCVAVAQSIDPREMENTARVQRMVESVSQALRDLPVRSLSGVKEGLVTIVMSATRRLSGWTAPQSSLADRVYPRLNQIGPAIIVGLSNDAPSTSHIRGAFSEARLALDFASVSERVVPYSEIPFRRMMVRLARDNIRSALPAWLSDFQTADRKAHGSLSKTLQAYADVNMNALHTARQLSVHPNTVYSRMQRIASLTGKNALTYHDLTELLLAIEAGAES